MFSRLFTLSWRSILRNKRRTIITGAAIGLGLAALMFTDALFTGMINYMVESSTGSWMGHAQIHREGFEETARIRLTVNNPGEVMEQLSRDTLVQGFTARLISPASLESAREMKPVTLTGVDWLTDRLVSSLESSIIQGEYLTGDSTEMIIGEKLAADMQLEVGDIAVVTAAMADSGFGGSMFIVSGICRFGSENLDRYTVFVNQPAAGKLLGLPGQVHEMAVIFADPMIADNQQLPFWNEYSTDSNIARGWPELAPQIHSMIQMVNVSVAVMALILFGLVLFGIINSLFMSVYERMYEFGIMKAIGTPVSTVVVLVLLEAFWLGICGVVIGLLLGWGVIEYFTGSGISFGEMEFSGVMLNRPIYPVSHPGRLWIYPVFTLIFTIGAGIYPGIHAGGLNPSKAIRKSL